jgi:tRNA (cytidine/uridine-2'-O-)-methyltransferase
MLNIVLIEPEIPQNCGNIARTCAATGSALHLVKPLGFDLSDRAVKRAGLDYWPLVDVRVYEDLEELFAKNNIPRRWFLSKKASRSYAAVRYGDGDFLFFGRESVGLPEALLRAHASECLRIPIRAEARSLNLSNSVAVVVFEALRQTGFPGLEESGEMLRWESPN